MNNLAGKALILEHTSRIDDILKEGLEIWVLGYPELNEIMFTLKEETAREIQQAVGENHCHMIHFKLTTEKDCGLLALGGVPNNVAIN